MYILYIYTYIQYDNIDRYFTYLTIYLGSTSKWDVIHPPRHPFYKLSDCAIQAAGCRFLVRLMAPERVRCSWGMVIHETGLEKIMFL